MACLNLLSDESDNWIHDHKIILDQSLQSSYSSLIAKFGPKLLLCYQERGTAPFKYRHYYVTDQTYVIEFGSGGNVTNNKVTVHCIPKENGIVEATFQNTEEVKKRMLAVAGATNYCLALRNCEHVAHFIKSGHWICLQIFGLRRKLTYKCVRKYNRSIDVFLKLMQALNGLKLDGKSLSCNL